MYISNDVAGSVIGKSGSKVAEIRKISGANVHISSEDEVTSAGERIVKMSGSADSVLIAQFLVQSNIEFFRRDRDGGGGAQMGGAGGNVLDNFSQQEAIRNNPEAMMVLNQMNQMLAGARNDTKGRGGANAKVKFHIKNVDSGARVFISTNLQLSGSVAQYGRGVGMIKDLAQQIIDQFSENLQKNVITPSTEPGEQGSRPQSAAPAQVGSIGLRVLWNAILRKIKSFFKS